MKIPNTVCSGCNKMLDLIYVMRKEFGTVNEAKCYDCNKEYPFRPCTLCKRDTIHVGNNFRACTDCILDRGFNLETEFNNSLGLLHSLTVGVWINREDEISENVSGILEESMGFFDSLERSGYDQKHYIDDNNSNLPNSNKGIAPK